MSRLAHQAEILKLARFLDVAPEKLSMLDPVPAEAIRRLREQATEQFFASDEAFFRRVVSASRLLPISILTVVAEKVLGPMLSARVAGQMDVDRGVGIAERLPTEFLATLCLSLDPQHTRDLVRAMPEARLRDVARELAARGEYVTMARFVDILDAKVIAAVIEEIDDAGLLHSAFFAENRARLEEIMAQLPVARLKRIIEAAADNAELWPDALSLMEHVGEGWRGRLGDLAAELDPSVLTSMITAVRDNALWSVALSVFACMSEASQRRFAALDILQDHDVLADAMAAADREQLWPQVLPMIAFMEESGRGRVAQAAETLDGEQMLRVAEAASKHEQWPQLLQLIAAMPGGQQSQTVNLLGMAPERTLQGLPEALEAEQAWDLLAGAWPTLAGGARKRLRSVAKGAGLTNRLPADPA
ncbi:hypothetical protein [Algiphilus aromaticivorans]|uniref:hypothetical protein n=1 Tax=Algiphilus aromaticivorans TaxID=382454 RepID=UPI0005C16282|nr:hypothetical protein [Algiphilus aromaticivorans]